MTRLYERRASEATTTIPRSRDSRHSPGSGLFSNHSTSSGCSPESVVAKHRTDGPNSRPGKPGLNRDSRSCGDLALGSSSDSATNGDIPSYQAKSDAISQPGDHVLTSDKDSAESKGSNKARKNSAETRGPNQPCQDSAESRGPAEPGIGDSSTQLTGNGEKPQLFTSSCTLKLQPRQN